MADSSSSDAWNNFVLGSQPSDHQAGSSMRSAALAKMYMGLANGGGINSFLTISWDFDAAEIVDALVSVGAVKAAQDLSLVLRGLGVPVPRSSQDARWNLMERYWTEALDEHDFLSDEADAESMRVLERHVSEHEDFYLAPKWSERAQRALSGHSRAE
jgi:hypothetical protein